ncbi:IGR protein motif-domain-containing protein [Kalaharituber pfeilii]|nr:IGR protein motif-domain-containing protein [Kalaharituber pfeilii]
MSIGVTRAPPGMLIPLRLRPLPLFRPLTFPHPILSSPTPASTLRNSPSIRRLHPSLPRPPVPAITSAVPDVKTFLTLIGRSASTHAPKISSWTVLFDSTSDDFKRAGVEPARLRRYIIHWREKYRRANGKIELKEVKRGVKKDGGERRRKMIRAIRRTQEYREKKREEEREAGSAEGEQQE